MKLKRSIMALYGLAWKARLLVRGHGKKASRWFCWLKPGRREAVQLSLFQEIDEAA